MFASAIGDHLADMALGYRYNQGIGVERSCVKAEHHYRNIANQGEFLIMCHLTLQRNTRVLISSTRLVVEKFLDGPPGGRTINLPHNRISDDFGGVYGPQGQPIFPLLNAGEEKSMAVKEVLEYYRYMSDRGEISAQV